MRIIQLGKIITENEGLEAKERIIIIDDNEDICNTLSLILEDEGYKTEIALTGQNAIKKIINKSYNVALLDINLPDVKGTELIISIKEINPNMDIIMITANTSSKFVIDALNNGASGYILKPFDNDNLLLKIKNKLEKQRLITEKWQAKQGLHDERDSLINILNFMQDGVCIVNQRHEIEFCNPVLIKEFGSVEGRKCYEYFHDSQVVCPWCKNQVVFKGKTVRREWYSLKNQKTYDLLDTPLKNSDSTISKLEIFRDITEQKNLLLKLKESEEIMRAILDSTKFMSNRWYTWTGFTPEDFYKDPETWQKSMHPDDRESTLKKFIEMYKLEKEYILEYRVIHNGTGEIYFLKDHGVPIYDGKGNLLRYDGIVTDISKQKEAEQKLKESEEIYRGLFKESPFFVILLDLEGKVYDINPNVEKVIGYKKQEVINQDFRELSLLPSEFIPIAIESFKSLLKGKKPKAKDLQFFTKDGELRWGNFQRSLLHIDNKPLIQIIGQDITERKQIEQKLKESEQKYRQLVENIPDAIYSTLPDETGTTTFMSNKWLAWTGFAPEDFYKDPKTWEKSIHPDDRESTLKKFNEMCEQEKEYILEYRVKHRETGEISFLRDHGVPIYDDKGNNLRYDGIVTNISDQKEAEKRLKESERLFRNLFETMTEGIVLVNAEGQIIQANPAAEHILGLTRSTIETRNFISPEWEILRPDGTSMPSNEMAGPRAMKEKRLVKNVIMGVRRPDETIIWINVSAAPLVDNNKISGIVGTFSDITERKDAEDKLKESEMALRKSQQELKSKNQISNILLTFPDENMFVKVLSIILKSLKSEFGIFGYLDENENLVEPSLTENVWEKCAIEDKINVFPKKLWSKNIYGRVINEKNSLFVNKSFNVPEGHVPISNFLGTPIIYDDKVIGIFIIANKESDYEEYDVKQLESISNLIAPILSTRLERDRLEEKRKSILKDLTKSEEKTREAYERENFYKNLFAHDIRNILQSVSSAEQVFSLFLHNPEKSQEKEKLLEIIRKQVIRGNILISNVQKLSQLEEIGITLKKVKIQEVLDESIEFIDKSFPEKEIDVTIDIPDKDYIVFANELILDAFENILNNSIKHNDNPIIEIDIRVSKDQWEERGCIKLEFIDNGRGIPAAKKEIIFQKGHQKDITSKGMGIGLSLVKKIIEYYNGHILVEDKVKGDYTKGSRFIIYIPEAL